MPYFNAPMYLQNKSSIGKVDEILGPINQVYFTIKPSEGVQATSFTEGDKVYIGGDKLLPLERFLPKPKPPPGTKGQFSRILPLHPWTDYGTLSSQLRSVAEVQAVEEVEAHPEVAEHPEEAALAPVEVAVAPLGDEVDRQAPVEASQVVDHLSREAHRGVVDEEASEDAGRDLDHPKAFRGFFRYASRSPSSLLHCIVLSRSCAVLYFEAENNKLPIRISYCGGHACSASNKHSTGQTTRLWPLTCYLHPSL